MTGADRCGMDVFVEDRVAGEECSEGGWGPERGEAVAFWARFRHAEDPAAPTDPG